MNTIDVDGLAQIIRQVDGNHDLGAGALAEAILDRLPAPQIIRTVAELEALDPDTVLWSQYEAYISASALLEDIAWDTEYEGDLPAVVIRDGAEVRAAREALEEA